MRAYVYSSREVGNRARRAKDPATPQATLAELAHDESWEVREAVASNHTTPPELLVALARDDAAQVRRLIAKHRHTAYRPRRVGQGHNATRKLFPVHRGYRTR